MVIFLLFQCYATACMCLQHVEGLHMALKIYTVISADYIYKLHI